MALLGLLLHYSIAFSFVGAYFVVAGRLPWLTAHRMLSGILFGIVVWSIMNLIGVPAAYFLR